MVKREVFQGEAKTLPFRIKDRRTGKALDMTGATFLLAVKRSAEETEVVFTKVDTDFNKTVIASGFVTTFLTAQDTCREPWNYLAELRVTLPGDPAPIEKLRFELEILPAITPNDWILQLAGIASLEGFGNHLVANI